MTMIRYLLILGYCCYVVSAGGVAATLQATSFTATNTGAAKPQDSGSNNNDEDVNSVQRKRGILNDGWVGLSSAYGLGQSWDLSPWKPIKTPSLSFDTSSWQYGGGLGGWPTKDIGGLGAVKEVKVPVVVTKHVLVEKPVTVEKVVHVPVERIVHKPVPVGIPVPHAVPVHISHAVPLPIRHAVPVPYHQPYPVPVRQPIPYAVPVPIPYPVHQNGPHYAAGAAGYGAIAAGLGPAYLGHPQAGSVAIKHAGLHAAPPYHLPHHHLGLAGHHRLVHAPAQAWAGGHRLVPPPVYLGHDFSGGQQHGLHYGHHHHHHHQLLSHGHVGHAGLLAASAEPHYHSQRSVKDEKTTSTSTKKDKRSKLKAETKNVDDRDEHETENDDDEN